MSENLKVISVIICDDIRKEISGKDILVGAYGGNITVSEIPALLPTLGIRIEFITQKAKIDDLTVQLCGPNNKPIFTATGEFENPQPEDSAVLNLVNGPQPLEVEGIYEIRFGPKEKTQPVYHFKVLKNPQLVQSRHVTQ